MSLFDFIEDEDLRSKVESTFTTKLEDVKTSTKTALQDELKTKIEDAVNGLKTKNKELLAEKKKIQESLKNYADLDPERAREAIDFLEKNKDAQLIKDGKIDELIDRRTASIKEDYTAKLSEYEKRIGETQQEYEERLEKLQTDLEKKATAAKTYETLYKTKVVEDTLRDAAVAAGVRPEAIDDILLRGKSTFTLGKDGTLEARDSDGKLVKDEEGSLVKPDTWLENMKKTKPHYWGDSVGTGATGSSARVRSDDLLEKLNKAAEKGDMETFRKIRAQMAG